MAKRQKIAKPRNAGTMTESAFFGMLRSTLRARSLRGWKPLQEAKKLVRRPYSGDDKRTKWEYQCSKCKKWYTEHRTVELEDGTTKRVANIEVDHIIEAGSLKCYDDIAGFVKRLFCEVDGLQVLCKECHNKKTYNK